MTLRLEKLAIRIFKQFMFVIKMVIVSQIAFLYFMWLCFCFLDFKTEIDFSTFGSRKHGDKNPLWFTLGLKEVLKGWDKGLQNMCAGERRKLTIPPSLAYGKEGQGNS